jgi:hypothetical protein
MRTSIFLCFLSGELKQLVPHYTVIHEFTSILGLSTFLELNQPIDNKLGDITDCKDNLKLHIYGFNSLDNVYENF